MRAFLDKFVRCRAGAVGLDQRPGVAVVLLGLLAPLVSAQCFTEQLSSPSQSSGDYFGEALSADGPWLVVGGRFAATVFLHDDKGTPLDATDDSWLLHTHLLSQDPLYSDGFGTAVAIKGDHLIVGAPLYPMSFPGGPGAVFIYRRVEGGMPGGLDDSWVQEAKLVGSMPGSIDLYFGSTVALEGKRAAVGSPNGMLSTQTLPNGIVHVFREDDGGTPLDPSDDVWIEETVLAANSTASFERFGAGLAINGNNLLIGSPKNPYNTGPGSVYHFRLDDGGTPGDPTDDTWVQQAVLTPPPGADGKLFGDVLDLDGSHALIGSDGGAFLFELDDAGTPADPTDDFWVDAGMLVAPDAGAADNYGMAVSLAGDRALIGAPAKLERFTEGVAYAFAKSAPFGGASGAVPVWTEITKLIAPSGPSVAVGYAVLLHGDQAIIGERGDFPFLTGDGTSGSFGAVLVYATPVAPWSYIEVGQAGALDSPCLIGAGSLASDADTVVTVDHGKANAAIATILGLTALQAPFKGSVLFPEPDVVLWSATDAAGTSTITARWPAGVPAGFGFFLQAWVTDPNAPGGYAATNALHAVVPP